MGIWAFLTGADLMAPRPTPAQVSEPTPTPAPEPVAGINQLEARPGRTTEERIDFHIARFERALAVQGGAPNEAELRRWLDYWRAMKAANEGIR